MKEAFGQVNLLTKEDSKLYYRHSGEPRPSITIPSLKARFTLIEAAMLAADLQAAVKKAEEVGYSGGD